MDLLSVDKDCFHELSYKMSIEANGKSNDEVGMYIITKFAISMFMINRLILIFSVNIELMKKMKIILI